METTRVNKLRIDVLSSSQKSMLLHSLYPRPLWKWDEWLPCWRTQVSRKGNATEGEGWVRTQEVGIWSGPAVVVSQQMEWKPLGTEWPRLVLPTYHLEPGTLNVWNSKWGGQPCDQKRGSKGTRCLWTTPPCDSRIKAKEPPERYERGQSTRAIWESYTISYYILYEWVHQSDMGEGSPLKLRHKFFDWVHLSRGSQEHLVGSLNWDYLFYHPDSWWWWRSSLGTIQL